MSVQMSNSGTAVAMRSFRARGQLCIGNLTEPFSFSTQKSSPMQLNWTDFTSILPKKPVSRIANVWPSRMSKT